MNNSRFPVTNQRSAQTMADTRTGTARKPSQPLPPPVKVQVYEILRDHGFAIGEALELAAKASDTYTSTPQRLFQFDAVTIEISAGQAKLIYAPRDHETAARSSERIGALLNRELDQRAREIRERRMTSEGAGKNHEHYQ